MALSTQDASVLRKQPNCCAPGQLLPVKWSCHLQFPRLTSGRTEAGTVRVVMVTESQACPHAEQKHVSTSAKSTRAGQEVSSDIRSPPPPPRMSARSLVCVAGSDPSLRRKTNVRHSSDAVCCSAADTSAGPLFRVSVRLECVCGLGNN